MAYHKGTPETARKPTDRLGWPQVRSGPLVIGGILTGIGAVAGMTGVAVAGTHVTVATRAWIKELETRSRDEFRGRAHVRDQTRR